MTIAKDDLNNDIDRLIDEAIYPDARTADEDNRPVYLDAAKLKEKLVIYITRRDRTVFDHAYKQGRKQHGNGRSG